MHSIEYFAENFGRAFYEHEWRGRRVPAPGGLSIEEAYAVQDRVAAWRVARGEEVAGYKVGCTSEAIRGQFGLASPICGRLFRPHLHADGVVLDWRAYAGCAIEPEMVLTIGTDLAGEDLSDAQLRAAIASVGVGIELHHYRFWFEPPTSQELICSGGIHAGLVIGAASVAPEDVSFERERFSVRCDGQLVSSAPASEIMGGPLHSLRWLVTFLTRRGMALKKGSLVIPGSPVGLVRIERDMELTVEIDGVGSATARFAAPSATGDSHPSPSALLLYDWLAMREDLPSSAADAVIGFGHFDLGIPRRCAEIVRQGLAQHVVFTGGIGAGTADLGRSEADAFREVLLKEAPGLADRVVVENRSTNTAENIRFTEDLLRRDHPALAFGEGIRSVLLVATPCRQRRVRQTWEKLRPDVPAHNAPPPITCEQMAALYAAKGQSFTAQLLGEWERLRDYPARGWIVDSPIPPEIDAAAKALRGESEWVPLPEAMKPKTHILLMLLSIAGILGGIALIEINPLTSHSAIFGRNLMIYLPLLFAAFLNLVALVVTLVGRRERWGAYPSVSCIAATSSSR